MEVIMLEAMAQAIREKEALLNRMADQMKPDIESGSIPPQTMRCFTQAQMNLHSLKLAVDQNKFTDVVHLYGRLCSCLGEYLGRKATQQKPL